MFVFCYYKAHLCYSLKHKQWRISVGGGFGDAPIASHTLILYDKSTGTVHGRLVQGLLLQAH